MTPANSPAEGYLAQVIHNRLARAHHLEPLAAWSLEHRLYRRNPLLAAEDAAAATRPLEAAFLQLLRRSHVPDRVHAAIAGSATFLGPEPLGPVVAIPVASHDEFVQFVSTRLQPFWAHRQTVHVAQGAAYGVGDFEVRVGEVRAGQGGPAQARGVVVEIAWVRAGAGPAGAEEAVAAMWDEIDTKDEMMRDAKKFFPGTEAGQEHFAARLWLEVLKLRP